MACAIIAQAGAAHPHFETAQQAHFTIAQEQLHLDIEFAPGSADALELITKLDQNTDGEIDELEIQKLAHSLLDQIYVSINEGELDLALDAVEYSNLDEMQLGYGAIKIFAQAPIGLVEGEHILQVEQFADEDATSFALSVGVDLTSPEQIKILNIVRSAEGRAMDVAFELLG